MSYENKRFKNWEYPKIEHGKLTKWNWMVHYPKGLKLGKYTDIGAFTYINAKFGVIIEDYVQIGVRYYVTFISGDSALHVNLQQEFKLEGGALIEIGTNILPEVNIGAWNIVGAGSVVIEDVSDNVIIVETIRKNYRGGFLL